MNKALIGTIVALPKEKYLDNFCPVVKCRLDCTGVAFPSGELWLQVSRSIWDNVATRQCRRIVPCEVGYLANLFGLRARVHVHECKRWEIHLLSDCSTLVAIVEPVYLDTYKGIVPLVLNVWPVLPFSPKFEKQLQ